MGWRPDYLIGVDLDDAEAVKAATLRGLPGAARPFCPICAIDGIPDDQLANVWIVGKRADDPTSGRVWPPEPLNPAG